MGIFNFNTLLCIQEGRPKLDDNVDQEEEIDTGVDERHCLANYDWVTLFFEKELQRDEKSVVEGQNDDEVVPVFDEVSTACKQVLFTRKHLLVWIGRLGVAVLTSIRTVVFLIYPMFIFIWNFMILCLSAIGFTIAAYFVILFACLVV